MKTPTPIDPTGSDGPNSASRGPARVGDSPYRATDRIEVLSHPDRRSNGDVLTYEKGARCRMSSNTSVTRFREGIASNCATSYGNTDPDLWDALESAR